MHRLLLLTVLAVATAIAFNLGRRVAADDGIASDTLSSGGADMGGSVEVSLPSRRSEQARQAALRAIAGQDTYLLAESDSILRRWVERERDPLLVYFEPAVVAGYTAAIGRAVRDAFMRWRRVGGLQVRFEFVRTRENADVTVRWVESFDMQRAGQADLVWRSDGHLQSGTLTLATHSYLGRPFTTDAIETVALHEIGHLLGLGHSDQPRDVMYPTTSVHDLTSRDRRTAMLLYSLPPGSLKGPRPRPRPRPGPGPRSH